MRNYFLFFLFFFVFSSNAELLILKKMDGKFVPLDEQDDKDAEKIIDVYLKYKWPLCIRSNLSPEEKEELLVPGKSYAEVKFIENKICEVTRNATYRVIFIPTVLYQLFIIHLFLVTRGELNPLQQAVNCFMKEVMITYEGNLFSTILQPISKSPLEAQEEIFSLYKKINSYFYTSSISSAFYYVNQKFAQEFCKKLSEKTNLNLSLGDNTSSVWAESLRESILSLYERKKEELNKSYFSLAEEIIAQAKERGEDISVEDQKKLHLDFLGFLEYQKTNLEYSLSVDRWAKIIFRVLKLEYKGQEDNTVFLYRGTSFIPFSLQDGSGEKIIAGNTIYSKFKDTYTVFPIGFNEKDRRAFRSLSFVGGSPYSISFSANILDASMMQPGDCSLNYLSGAWDTHHSSPDVNGIKWNLSSNVYKGASGYALALSKKDYLETFVDNLFFIPLLSPLTALFSGGQTCHPRSIAAIADKEVEKVYTVEGIKEPVLDPAGFFIVKRDPLKHAQLFSEFLAKHMHLLMLGDESDITLEEKEVLKEIKKNQKKVAGFYKNIRTFEKVVNSIEIKDESLQNAWSEEKQKFRVFGWIEEFGKDLSKLAFKVVRKVRDIFLQAKNYYNRYEKTLTFIPDISSDKKNGMQEKSSAESSNVITENIKKSQGLTIKKESKDFNEKSTRERKITQELPASFLYPEFVKFVQRYRPPYALREKLSEKYPFQEDLFLKSDEIVFLENPSPGFYLKKIDPIDRIINAEYMRACIKRYKLDDLAIPNLYIYKIKDTWFSIEEGVAGSPRPAISLEVAKQMLIFAEVTGYMDWNYANWFRNTEGKWMCRNTERSSFAYSPFLKEVAQSLSREKISEMVRAALRDFFRSRSEFENLQWVQEYKGEPFAQAELLSKDIEIDFEKVKKEFTEMQKKSSLSSSARPKL